MVSSETVIIPSPEKHSFSILLKNIWEWCPLLKINATTEEYQLKVKWIIELEHSPFCNHCSHTLFRQNQLLLKPLVTRCLENRIFTQSEILPSPNNVLLIKGKRYLYNGEIWVIKLTITNNWRNQCLVPPDIMYWEENITYMVFLPKMFSLNLIMREQSDKFKSRDIHILLPGLSKTTKIMKNQKKKKSENFSRIKEIKKIK